MSASKPTPGEDAPEGARLGGARPFRLRAVLFDFDGTLTRPGALDFAAIKREVGCPPDRFVLEWIQELPEGAERDAAAAALERFELAAADASEPNDGVEHVVRALRTAGVAIGVLTRNGQGGGRPRPAPLPLAHGRRLRRPRDS